jgi:methionyl-tRNA synthetase
VLYNVAESMRITGILLQPFMPTKAKEILDVFRVDSSKRKLSDATYGSDADYGEDIEKKIIFPPLVSEE